MGTPVFQPPTLQPGDFERPPSAWKSLAISRLPFQSPWKKLGGGNSNIFHSYLGKIPILTSIFFKWVETTNQKRCAWDSQRDASGFIDDSSRSRSLLLWSEWTLSASTRPAAERRIRCTFFCCWGSGQLGGGDDTTMYLVRQYIPTFLYPWYILPIRCNWVIVWYTCQVITSTRNIHWWGGSEA